MLRVLILDIPEFVELGLDSSQATVLEKQVFFTPQGQIFYVLRSAEIPRGVF